MQELMKEGRKGVQEIDGTLNRAEKVVEDTLQIGQQVRGQTAVRRTPWGCLQDGHAATAMTGFDADVHQCLSPCRRSCALVNEAEYQMEMRVPAKHGALHPLSPIVAPESNRGRAVARCLQEGSAS